MAFRALYQANCIINMCRMNVIFIENSSDTNEESNVARMPMLLTSMKIRMFLCTLIQSVIPILKQLEFCYPLRMTRFVQSIHSGARKFNDLSQLAHVDDIKSDYCGHWIHNGKKMTTVAVWKQGTVVMLAN